MWIFPCILFTLGLLITIIKLSLAVKLRNGIVVVLVAAFLPLPLLSPALSSAYNANINQVRIGADNQKM